MEGLPFRLKLRDVHSSNQGFPQFLRPLAGISGHSGDRSGGNQPMKKARATTRYATIHGEEGWLTLVSDRSSRDLQMLSTGDLYQVQKWLSESNPDVVVLDLHLPITYGLKLIKLVREVCPRVSMITKLVPGLTDTRFFSVEACDNSLVLRPLESGERKPAAGSAVRPRPSGGATMPFH